VYLYLAFPQTVRFVKTCGNFDISAIVYDFFVLKQNVRFRRSTYTYITSAQHIHIGTHIHTYAHIYTHTHTYTHVHNFCRHLLNVRVCVYTHTHAYTHAYTLKGGPKPPVRKFGRKTISLISTGGNGNIGNNGPKLVFFSGVGKLARGRGAHQGFLAML